LDWFVLAPGELLIKKRNISMHLNIRRTSLFATLSLVFSAGICVAEKSPPNGSMRSAPNTFTHAESFIPYEAELSRNIEDKRNNKLECSCAKHQKKQKFKQKGEKPSFIEKVLEKLQKKQSKQT
jgi:hypothetical protein